MLRSMYKPGSMQPQARSSPLVNQVDMTSSQEDEEEDEEADGLGALPSSSAAMAPPPLLPRNKGTTSSSSKTERRYDGFSPLSADDCFQEALEVDVPDRGAFRVYFTPPRPQQHQSNAPAMSAAPHRTRTTTVPKPADPALASLRLPVMDEDDDDDNEHGNSSPSSSASSSSPGTLIFFHHGAGFSALSFALTARAVTKLTRGEVGVLALDCRGHGRTAAPSNDAVSGADMSLSSLTADSLALLRTLYPPGSPTPTLVLVGHSMGGSVVTSLCPLLQQEANFHVAGVVVLDVVEGTALDALQGMENIVASQPKGFASMREAIKWHVDRGTGASIRNVDSARRSVPALLKENPQWVEGVGPETEDDEQEAVEELEYGGGNDDGVSLQSPTRQPRLIWRHSLASTTPHWRGWFTGLSQRFLSVRTARLLILAGTDRLDKDLMVGQMQGKYQTQVLPEAGHCIMEDEPEKVARLIVDFWRRNEVVVPVKMGGGGVVPVRKVGQ